MNKRGVMTVREKVLAEEDLVAFTVEIPMHRLLHS
jgi:hypothetical protein